LRTRIWRTILTQSIRVQTPNLSNGGLIGTRGNSWHTRYMLESPTSKDLKRLLPAPAHTILSTRLPTDLCPMPAIEQAALDTMHPARRSEFIHGRACARTALGDMGFPDPVIPVGASREPVWPDGIVGSISHCGDVAAAAVARREEIGGLGIDLELAEPLDSQTMAMVCHKKEQAWLRRSDDALHLAKLIFSAKESIYKCIWPSIRRFVDFQDISIQIDAKTNCFAPVDWAEDLPDRVISSIRGRYLLRNGWIMTTACLPHHQD
jgi:4'-phosphopantetheinyl transferase EntD